MGGRGHSRQKAQFIEKFGGSESRGWGGHGHGKEMFFHPWFGVEERGEGWAGVGARQALNLRMRGSCLLLGVMENSGGFLSRGATLSDLSPKTIPWDFLHSPEGQDSGLGFDPWSRN